MSRGRRTCAPCCCTRSAPTAVERWRLSFPPHDREAGLRLACQVKVQGDLEVTKYGGVFGQHVGEPPVADPDRTRR